MEFSFFNNDVNITTTEISKLETKIKNLLTKYTYSDLTKACMDDNFIKDLNTDYKSIFGKKKLNQTSMVLFHHPLIYDDFKHHYYECYRCYSIWSTLLTGDIDFKNTGDFAIKVNSGIFESGFPLSICSLPHHGNDKYIIK